MNRGELARIKRIYNELNDIASDVFNRGDDDTPAYQYMTRAILQLEILLKMNGWWD